MKNVFKIVITILMAILILILIWVLVKYYKDDPFTTTSSTVIVEPPIENVEPQVITDLPGQNGNNGEDIQIDDNHEQAGEMPTAELIDDNTPNNKTTKPNISENEPVFITSSEKTSNAEKQEVLNEIDKALMELLQVVDKVKGVDETRLGIDESEVQQ